MMDWLPPDQLRILLRLAAATLAGMIIGLNRDLKGKSIGMRTLGLVSLSSAGLVLSGEAYTGLLYSQDAVSRIIQGIVTGIGFLGAGVILHGADQKEVKGLTTAATVWVAATLGITAGLGAWLITIAGTVLALALLVFGLPIENAVTRLFRSKGSEERDPGVNGR